MKNYVSVKIEVTDEMIDDICCSAFEGGITYWCNKAEVVGGDLKGASYASDAISRGASILLHEFEDDHVGKEDTYTLTKEKVLVGIQMYVTNIISDKLDRILDLSNIDSEDADIIIQYGLFGEIVYG